MIDNYEYILIAGQDVIDPTEIVGLPALIFIPNDDKNADWMRYQQWLLVPNDATPSGFNEPMPPAYQQVSDGHGGVDPTQIIRLPDNFLVTEADAYNWGVWQTWIAISWNEAWVRPPADESK